MDLPSPYLKCNRYQQDSKEEAFSMELGTFLEVEEDYSALAQEQLLQTHSLQEV
jgi:hypothetical protein